jgi:hypothetical protein
MTIRLFHQQLQLAISEQKARSGDLILVLSLLIHLNPFQTMGSGELGFLWIAGILNSRYQEQGREEMASKVVELLGKHFFHGNPAFLIHMEPTWIPPLLGFLSLGEKLGATKSTRSIALRILASSPGPANFGPIILPILHSTLLPTHPLQSRHLALQVFNRFKDGWFSSQMENIPSEDLNELVRAVGDPFQFPDPPLQDGKPMDPRCYNPVMVAHILIGFALSDLWRVHLHRSNFASCEEIVSTWDGKKTFLECMDSHPFLKRLSTAAKLIMAIRHLEELQCSNTAEVVIMWAWTIGVVNPVDRDAWQLIGCDTLQFYQTHGLGRLITLKRHLTGGIMESSWMASLFMGRLAGPDSRWQLPPTHAYRELDVPLKPLMHLHISRACQLRRLYQLFGYDPTTWKEAVGVEEVDEETGVSEHSIVLAPFMDWACDYP